METACIERVSEYCLIKQVINYGLRGTEEDSMIEV